jgi:hypothetical protein
LKYQCGGEEEGIEVDVWSGVSREVGVEIGIIITGKNKGLLVTALSANHFY